MKAFYTFLMLCVATSLYTNDGIHPITNDLPFVDELDPKRESEMAKLDQLIAATRIGLESQLRLRDLLLEYLQVQKIYMENTKDKQNGFRMVRKAGEVFERIQENHLTHLFDPEFLSEIAFFAGIANKWSGEETP